ncbi:MAG TPA: hypothetical protein VNL39_06470 [Xanthobacteraceae bacterium]|nr:hypothetical protein [Xanthobacteraceae bacterium]
MRLNLLEAREFWFGAEKTRISMQATRFILALQGSSCKEQEKIILKTVKTTLSRFCIQFSQRIRREDASRVHALRGLGKYHDAQNQGHTINA